MVIAPGAQRRGRVMYQGLSIPHGAKIAICVLADIFDFTAGRVLIGAGTVGDFALTPLVMFILWGPIGLLSIWEAIDVTEQFDGFVPTNTVIALIAHKRHSEGH
jgi:hypothetical protein